VKRKSFSDVSLATFYVFDKENAGPPPLFQKLRLAVGGGAGCGCSFGCATSAASEGKAADTASKEEASALHELNGVRHSRLSQALRDRLTTS
jgi:hypothetical protein